MEHAVPSSSSRPRGRPLGRYVLYEAIATGGMASVHFARLRADGGFARTVAIKRLHGHLAVDEQFAAMFQDEARLAARIRHPNVVPTLDVVAFEKELFLVMEYVDGESLWNVLRGLARASRCMPLRIASAILTGVLHGLHAAHEAKSEAGQPLHLVHRDVSPHNVVVGVDGVPRVLDFGIAKAIGRVQTTADGQVKGKASYMAPEQLRGGTVDARTDVYAASVVAWEVLTCQRLFVGGSPEATMNAVLERVVPPPSSVNEEVPAALDAIVLRGLARDPAARFPTARDMAIAIESLVPPASAREVGDFLSGIAGDALARRARVVADIESDSDVAPASFEASPPPTDATQTTRIALAKRGRRAGVIAFVAAGAVSIGFAVAWMASSSRSAGAVPPSAPGSAPDPSLAASPAPSASSRDVARAPEPPVDAAAPAAAAASWRPAPRKGPFHKATRAGTRNCDPPYTIDANGFRSPKPECI